MELLAFNIYFAAVNAVIEAWLCKVHSYLSFDIYDYVMFRIDRVGSKGGALFACMFAMVCMQLFCELLNMSLVLLRSMNLCG
jgi:hypothetical protein